MSPISRGIFDLIESVSEGSPTYSYTFYNARNFYRLASRQ